MSTLITQGASTIAPTLVLGYEAERESGNNVHPILGRTNPDVTLRPAGPRRGTLQLGFAMTTSEALSKTAEDLFTVGGVFTLSDTDLATVAMSFVVSDGGRIRRTLEDETRNAWIVSVDFTEVTL